MANLYKVNAGDIPFPSDVNQYADAFTGNNDVGQLYLADYLNNPSTAPTAATAAGSGLAVGIYKYVYTYVTGYKKSNGSLLINGETNSSPVVTITTTSGNQVVNLSGIATSTASYVIARRVYRTKVNPSVAPTLSATANAGSTLSPATYYVQFTWVYTGGGESLPSPEASQAVTSGQQLNVTIPSFPPGVSSANIYISTSSGLERYQTNITTTSTSFTSPISTSGAYPPAASTFYLLTQINDNVTTTLVDSTADTALSTTTAPIANTTGSFFSKLNFGSSVPNTTGMNIKAISSDLHVQSPTGNVFNETGVATYLTGNAYFDGTNWYRYSTGQAASALVIQNNQEPQFWAIGSGTGPITWNQYRIFHEGNFTTRTHAAVYLNASQTLVGNSWNRIKFDTRDLDYLNEFDVSNWWFTAQNTGIYVVTFSVRIQGMSGSGTLRLGVNQLNRSGYAYDAIQIPNTTAGTINLSTAIVLNLPAGTQLEMRVWTDNFGGATLATGRQNTWAVISRIA